MVLLKTGELLIRIGWENICKWIRPEISGITEIRVVEFGEGNISDSPRYLFILTVNYRLSKFSEINFCRIFTCDFRVT